MFLICFLVVKSLAHRFLYNARKKDGTKSKKLTTETILFTYCPFCGKKYKG